MAMGYFPGCSLEGTASEFGMSIVEVARRLGVELREIEDWNCCGASAAHQTNHELSLALPARTLALARSQGMSEIFAPCAACSNRLIAAQAQLLAEPRLRERLQEIVGMELPAQKMAILNAIELFLPRLDQIGAAARAPASGKKAACYYGCLLLRPPAVVRFDDPEAPQSMEKVVACAGAEAVEWAFKNECCGAAFAMSSTPSVVRLIDRILRNAREEGADMVVTACPLCHANLDMRQSKRRLGFRMPILYISQLVGLALGVDPKSLGLAKHLTPVTSILN